jgi:hypothetical protein
MASADTEERGGARGESFSPAWAVIAIAGVAAAAWISSRASSDAAAAMRPPSAPLSPKTPEADGCPFVYIDVGTNIGVQFHKLYDKDRFPDALVKPVFDGAFGNASDRSHVCSWGWEPNPGHRPVLDRMVKHYKSKGYRVSVSHTAAGTFEGYGVFKSDGDLEHKEWGAHVEPLPQGLSPMPSANTVIVSDVPTWILHNVVWRTWEGRSSAPGGPASAAGRVVMKIDAEGSDERILAAMVRNGALCGVDILYTEGHVRPEVSFKYNEALATAGCPTRIIVMDDETYLTYELP